MRNAKHGAPAWHSRYLSTDILLRKTNKTNPQSCLTRLRGIKRAAVRGRRLETALSLLTLRRFVSRRIHSIWLLVFFTLITTPAAYPQAPEQKITSVVVFPQAGSTTSTQDFVLEIKGTGFGSLDMSNVHVAVLPATGVTGLQVLSRSQDNSTILAQFTAPANYAPEEVALSTPTFLTYDTGAASCDFKSKVTLTPQIVPKDQAGNKYGNGVAKNFYAIQISIVNECPMAVIVPIAGMRVIINTALNTPSPLPSAVIGAPYLATLSAAGGTPPIQVGEFTAACRANSFRFRDDQRFSLFNRQAWGVSL